MLILVVGLLLLLSENCASGEDEEGFLGLGIAKASRKGKRMIPE